jgi:hypothetical protein
MAIRSTITAFALAAGMLAGTAQAETSMQGSAAINGFTYKLIDLTPDDGQTPWIKLGEANAFTYAALYGNQGFSGPTALSDFGVGNSASTVANGIGSAQAIMNNGFGVSFLDLNNNAGLSLTGNNLNFVLAPNTMVVFSASGAANLSYDPAQASMHALAGIYGKAESGLLFTSAIDLSGASDAAFPLTASLSSGANEMNANVSFQTTLQGNVLSPVPEPAEAGMLALGLALLPAWMRRRKQKQNQKQS